MTRPPHADVHPRLTAKGAWAAVRRFGLVWLALMGLLTASCLIAYVPLGPWNLVAGIAIALLKAGLVVAFFMGLEKAPRLNRLAAAAGILLVLVLFTLSFSDLLTRL